MLVFIYSQLVSISSVLSTCQAATHRAGAVVILGVEFLFCYPNLIAVLEVQNTIGQDDVAFL